MSGIKLFSRLTQLFLMLKMTTKHKKTTFCAIQFNVNFSKKKLKMYIVFLDNHNERKKVAEAGSNGIIRVKLAVFLNKIIFS